MMRRVFGGTRRSGRLLGVTRAAARLASGAVMLVGVACASRGAPSPSDQAAGGASGSVTRSEAPRLTALRPSTIALGKGEVPTLVLTGSGFVPGTTGTFAIGANRVRVGPAIIEGVASDSSGTTLTFALPLTYTDTTAKGRPSSFAPGQYPVSVITPRGTSNTLLLTMNP